MLNALTSHREQFTVGVWISKQTDIADCAKIRTVNLAKIFWFDSVP